MTQEEKAKRYDEAVINGSRLWECGEITRENYEYIFPELKDSEDEKIRKELLNYLYDVHDDDEERARWIAWLEKQGEQKPADRVEQKFKVGDWVIDKQGVVHQIANVVGNVTNHTYGYDIVGGGYFNDNIEGVRLWTIQDAKNGDVLHSTVWGHDSIFIFNGLDYWKFDEPNGDRAVATAYCCLDVYMDKMEFVIQGPDCIEVNTVKPATKIQRDILFEKMKEAGYEWDAEKNELKELKKSQRMISAEAKEALLTDGLTDFEKCFQGMCHEENQKFAKACCVSLMALARKQIVSEIDLYAMEKDFMDNNEESKTHFASYFYKMGIEDTLKAIKKG